MASDAQCIQTVEQLQRLIETEQWYESDGDTSDELESEPLSDDEGSIAHSMYQDVWGDMLWQDEDDPSFGSSSARPVVWQMSAEVILRQLNIVSEETDFEDGNLKKVGDIDNDIPKDATTETSQATSSATCDSNSQELKPYPQFPESASSETPEKPKHYYIAHEIMTTERTYVQSLRLLEKVVHGAIKTATLTGKTILPEAGRKDIFLNIGEIYALSFDLLQELEDRLENWDSNPMIADVLAIRAPFFKLYTMYSSRFDSAQVAYGKWLKSCKTFAELIRTVESSRLSKGLPVSSYMLCPIQRIPRYRLLLEDYLKHLPEGNPDIENTKAALAAVSEAAIHMNDRIKELESQAQVVKMQRSFAGKENIVAPGRKYLGRGPVFSTPAIRGIGSLRKRKQRVLFLFSDVVFVTGVTANGRYKIQHKLSIKDLLVSVAQSPLMQNAFCIAEKGMTKPFRFITKTLHERNMWITELHKAITEDSKRRKPFSSTEQYTRLLSDPEAHSSILAVLNDPSFEHSQPSWVRRSIRLSHSARAALPLSSSSFFNPSGGGGDGGGGVREEVDYEDESVETEFISEDNTEKAPRALQPGMVNNLSSYMCQKSVNQELWKRRWFVLTATTLVCYEHHQCDEACGALLLNGYTASAPPDRMDGTVRPNVFKLSHAKKRPYFFQLPSSHSYDLWFNVLRELLQTEANTLMFS